MYVAIGIITLLGILTAISRILKYNRAIGICQLVLAIVCPIFVLWFCSLKAGRAFGGTDWEFLVHSASVDGDFCPWIILVLFGVEVIFIVGTIVKTIKAKNTN